METYFFYALSAVAVIAALMVPLSRNAVNAAMFMILCLIATAGLFAMLGAYFLAALQVLVYAGAIMVLFVFIIMLIDVQQEQRLRLRWPSLIAGGLAASLLVAGLIGLGMHSSLMQAMPELPADSSNPLVFTGAAQPYGAGLFGKYMLPIQVMGFLLLIAMIGVILITKDLAARAGVKPSASETNPPETH
jgi:NADH-quinone oxidoreductase subunit J